MESIKIIISKFFLTTHNAAVSSKIQKGPYIFINSLSFALACVKV